jgi:hypothetical protein
MSCANKHEMKPRSIAPRVCQLLGTGFLVIVVLSHVCASRHLLPWMGWGLKHSAGHYLGLSSAILGLILLPSGFLLQAFEKRI